MPAAGKCKAETEFARGFALEGSSVPKIPDGIFVPVGEWDGVTMYKLRLHYVCT